MRAAGNSFLFRYGFAAIAAALSVALRIALTPLLGPHVQFITLFPAVVLSALFGGFGAGIVATLLGGLALNYFLVAPTLSFSSSPDELSQLAVFLVMGTFISWVASDRRRIKGRLEAIET